MPALPHRREPATGRPPAVPLPSTALGPSIEGETIRLRLFTTEAATCQVALYDRQRRPLGRQPMVALEEGTFETLLPFAPDGVLYMFVLDERELPDPYAHFLPFGVHGPALAAASSYHWRHSPVARPLREHVIYELHVGAFTEAGTYQAARERLPELAQLGITAIELMPLSSFAGERGWGYDSVALFAPHPAYGARDELRAFIDEAHGLGLAVLLDVVYNHFGAAGNYLAAYSPRYFSPDVRNAWGAAPAFDDPLMRGLVLANARYWLEEFRFDGLRLDATHAIVDRSPTHILRELAGEVARMAPRRLLIAEDERNEPALVAKLGLDAIWADDFHHQVRVLATGEQDGYYAAYRPQLGDLIETIRGGWLYRGQVYPATGHPRGRAAGPLPAEAFVYCLQNHDQVGNRALGDRLNHVIPVDAYCAASALLLFLPMTPLLFMGQEWAASTPFQYFTDHEPELGLLVSRGRREEFKHFRAFRDAAAQATIPDPQHLDTFLRSRLRWDERGTGDHARVLALYRRLLELRRTDEVLRQAPREALELTCDGSVLVARRWHGDSDRVLVVNFSAAAASLDELASWVVGRAVLARTDDRPPPPAILPGHTAVLLGARSS